MGTGLNETPIEVIQIGKIRLIGNIIPYQWYKELVYESGKPNLPAITILGDIVNWYTPIVVRDEMTGEVIEYKKKFKHHALQKSYASFEMYGLTRKQAQDACHYLQEKELIKLEVSHIKVDGVHMNNCLFIHILPKNILKISVANAKEPKISAKSSLELLVTSVDKPVAEIEKPPRAIGKRLSEDFEVDEKTRVWVKQKFPQLTESVVNDCRDNFIDYWTSETGAKTTKLDWQKAFKNWIRKHVTFNKLETTGAAQVPFDNGCDFCKWHKEGSAEKCPFHGKK